MSDTPEDDARAAVSRLIRDPRPSDWHDFPDPAVQAATEAAAVALWGRPADADATATARVAVDAALPHLRDCPCPCFTAGQAAARRQATRETDELVTGLRQLARDWAAESRRLAAFSDRIAERGDSPSYRANRQIAKILKDVSQELQELADGAEHG